MSNIKKLPKRKLTQKKSSVVPFKRDNQCTVINLEEKINKAIELRLGQFVKEIQQIKIKQRKLEARHKMPHLDGTVKPFEKQKQPKTKLKQKKSTKNKSRGKKTKK